MVGCRCPGRAVGSRNHGNSFLWWEGRAGVGKEGEAAGGGQEQGAIFLSFQCLFSSFLFCQRPAEQRDGELM